jgi:hypothetical protein
MTHHYVLPWPPSKNRLHRAIKPNRNQGRVEMPEQNYIVANGEFREHRKEIVCY